MSIKEADDTPTQTYIITSSGADHTISPSVTHRIPDCSMSADFFYWDDTTSSWKALIGSTYENDPFKTLDTTTG